MDWRFILYPEGYHMLTRDLQAEKVFKDIEYWVQGLISGNTKEVNGIKPQDHNFLCGENNK